MSKVIVITGASSGIGAAILKSLAKEGHAIIGLARRSELIDAIKKENSDWKIHSYKIDITEDKKVQEAFNWIKSEFKKIDVLINNAGVADRTLVTEGKIDIWKKLYELNIFAVGSCIREAVKIITEGGQIINVSSAVGQDFSSIPGLAVYSSTKHALKILTKGLRLELIRERPDIKVTLLNPGLTETDLATKVIEDHPQIPYIAAENIAQAVLFAVSTPKFVNVTELTVQHSGEFVR